jgi:chromosome segregation ATPase
VFEKMSKSEGRPNIGTALRRWADAWGKYRTYRQRLVEVSELVKFRGSEIHKLEAALLEVKSAMEKETEEHNKLKSSLDYAGDKILNLETALENSRKRLENAERYLDSDQKLKIIQLKHSYCFLLLLAHQCKYYLFSPHFFFSSNFKNDSIY